MLKHLVISNYALIDSADIVFEKGFTVITGETGAGKSIMLGALALLLGQRADTSVIRDKEQKCLVEATFILEKEELDSLFASEDVDFDTETVIRREILPSGKSRSFVNDTPVTLNFLKELSRKIIDVHSQHQNLMLGDFDFQLRVLDTVAGNYDLKSKYQEEFTRLRQLQSQRDEMIQAHEKQQADRDYMEFQARQLKEAQLVPGELVELERESEQLANAGEIKSTLSEINTILVEHDFPLVDTLHKLRLEIGKIAKYLRRGDELAGRTESIYEELKDISREIGAQASTIEFDPQRAKIVQERLDLIYSLLQKHKLQTVEGLIELLAGLEAKLSRISSHQHELEELSLLIDRQQEILRERAIDLSNSRLKVLGLFGQTVENQLVELGIPYARFQVSRTASDTFRHDGIDEVQFLFTANKNSPLGEIQRVASGGEMSRVMLSIKSLLSSTRKLPTIIFDEIDAGVSGEIADRMGRIMKKMGLSMQVISITHLPQIASKGSNHIKVYKSDVGHQSVTAIKYLLTAERVLEIAGMLSGSEMSDAAIDNARHLLESSA